MDVGSSIRFGKPVVLRVVADRAAQADRLLERLRGSRLLAACSRPSRASMLRLALAVGLEQLEGKPRRMLSSLMEDEEVLH